MHHDIGAVLERTDEIRRAERVVHHHGQPMGMGKRGDGIDVGDIRVGVAKGLEIDERSLRTDRRLDLGQIVDIHERGLDPKIGEGVGQQVVCAAVDGLLGNHVSPGASKRLDGEGDRCRARRNRTRRHSTFECGDAILQYTLGGVCLLYTSRCV